MTGTFRRYPLAAFFILAYLLSWIILIPLMLSQRGIGINLPFDLFFLLGGWGPTVAAVLIVWLTAGKLAVKTFLARALQWKVGVRWYFVVMFLPSLTGLGAILLHVLLGGEPPQFLIREYGFMLIPIILVGLFTGPISEEFGWRGFAQPLLQNRVNPIFTSLIIGALWGLWHIPLFYTPGTSQVEMNLFWFTINGIALAFLFTWIYNNTGGSILMAILFHAAINLTPAFIPTIPYQGIAERIYHIQIGLNWLIALLILPSLIKSGRIEMPKRNI
ncbi:MAG: type II CAAX prenyl endopeptidase Rce1 family protein [Anaerolineales bacterium]